MTTFNLSSFETAVSQLNYLAIDHYVLNVHKSLSPIVETIQAAINKATPTQLLYKLDLRPVFSPTGNPQNWSLEACSPTQSLGIVGESATS